MPSFINDLYSPDGQLLPDSDLLTEHPTLVQPDVDDVGDDYEQEVTSMIRRRANGQAYAQQRVHDSKLKNLHGIANATRLTREMNELRNVFRQEAEPAKKGYGNNHNGNHNGNHNTHHTNTRTRPHLIQPAPNTSSDNDQYFSFYDDYLAKERNRLYAIQQQQLQQTRWIVRDGAVENDGTVTGVGFGNNDPALGYANNLPYPQSLTQPHNNTNFAVNVPNESQLDTTSTSHQLYSQWLNTKQKLNEWVPSIGGSINGNNSSTNLNNLNTSNTNPITNDPNITPGTPYSSLSSSKAQLASYSQNDYIPPLYSTEAYQHTNNVSGNTIKIPLAVVGSLPVGLNNSTYFCQHCGAAYGYCECGHHAYEEHENKGIGSDFGNNGIIGGSGSGGFTGSIGGSNIDDELIDRSIVGTPIPYGIIVPQEGNTSAAAMKSAMAMQSTSKLSSPPQLANTSKISSNTKLSSLVSLESSKLGSAFGGDSSTTSLPLPPLVVPRQRKGSSGSLPFSQNINGSSSNLGSTNALDNLQTHGSSHTLESVQNLGNSPKQGKQPAKWKQLFKSPNTSLVSQPIPNVTPYPNTDSTSSLNSPIAATPFVSSLDSSNSPFVSTPAQARAAAKANAQAVAKFYKKKQKQKPLCRSDIMPPPSIKALLGVSLGPGNNVSSVAGSPNGSQVSLGASSGVDNGNTSKVSSMRRVSVLSYGVKSMNDGDTFIDNSNKSISGKTISNSTMTGTGTGTGTGSQSFDNSTVKSSFVSGVNTASSAASSVSPSPYSSSLSASSLSNLPATVPSSLSTSPLSTLTQLIRSLARRSQILAPLDSLATSYPSLLPVVLLFEVLIMVWTLHQAAAAIRAIMRVVRVVCAPAVVVGKFLAGGYGNNGGAGNRGMNNGGNAGYGQGGNGNQGAYNNYQQYAQTTQRRGWF